MEERRYSVSVNGLTPICFNRKDFRPPKTGRNFDWDEWEEQNWEKRLYRNEKSEVYIPRTMTRGGLVAATSFCTLPLPKGRRSFKPFVQGCLIIENDAILEHDPKKLRGWKDYVDRGNGSVPIIRPVIDLPWSFGVTISVFDDALKAGVIEDLWEICGRVCGLGEARSYQGFGRFRARINAI